MLNEALRTDGPAVLRFPNGTAREVPPEQAGLGLSGQQLRDGSDDGHPADVCVLAVGKMVEAAEDAADKLAAEGVSATVWDVRVVRPLDPAMIADAARHRLVVTVEDGMRVGGAGAFIQQAIADHVASPAHEPAVIVLGTPSEYIAHAKVAAILARVGLDGEGVAATILSALRDP